MLNRTITIEMNERERKEAAASRRFPVSVSSEAPVQRSMYGERWTEILSHAPDVIDLSRAPLPLLEGHDTRRTNVGIVTNLKVAGGRLRGELVLGSSQRAQELAADIGDGIVSGLSVGYTIEGEQRDEKARRLTATRWMPYEVSITPIPADTSVGINRSQTMEETNKTQTTESTITETPEAAERQRAADILNLVETAKLPASFARTLITTEGVTLERARTLVLNRLADESERIRTEQHVDALSRRETITAGDDFTEDFHRAAVDSLLIRAGPGGEAPRGRPGHLGQRLRHRADVHLPRWRPCSHEPAGASHACCHHQRLPGHPLGRAPCRHPQRLRDGAGEPPRLGARCSRHGPPRSGAPDPRLRAGARAGE